MSEAMSRDLRSARAAFETGDRDASQRAHTTKSPSPEAGHFCGERSVEKAFIFAGLEGLAAAVSMGSLTLLLNLNHAQAVSLVFAGTSALGLACSLREFERTREAFGHFYKEREREMWELKNFPEGALE